MIGNARALLQVENANKFFATATLAGLPLGYKKSEWRSLCAPI